MGTLIVVSALLLIGLILSVMMWQWCNTYDWQDRYR